MREQQANAALCFIAAVHIIIAIVFTTALVKLSLNVDVSLWQVHGTYTHHQKAMVAFCAIILIYSYFMVFYTLISCKRF